jgi:hypothetical protein
MICLNIRWIIWKVGQADMHWIHSASYNFAVSSSDEIARVEVFIDYDKRPALIPRHLRLAIWRSPTAMI